MYSCAQWRGSPLRGVGTRSRRCITQDTLSDLLFCGNSNVAVLEAILSRRDSLDLNVARSIWSGIR
jgi:hypothetical protein